MKITKKNTFNNKVAKVKKKASEINLKSMFGKIETFFKSNEFEDEYYEYNEEKKTEIYYLTVYDVSEYQFVITLLESGYTVIMNVELLTRQSKEMFRKKLQIELMKKGIYCHFVNSDVFIVAPIDVEIIDFEEIKETEETENKILYLSDYRDKLKKK